MCLRKEKPPIMDVEISQSASIATNHSQIAHRAITRNVCLEGSQFRALGQTEVESENDLVFCGKRVSIPGLDEIEGQWDDEDDS